MRAREMGVSLAVDLERRTRPISRSANWRFSKPLQCLVLRVEVAQRLAIWPR